MELEKKSFYVNVIARAFLSARRLEPGIRKFAKLFDRHWLQLTTRNMLFRKFRFLILKLSAPTIKVLYVKGYLKNHKLLMIAGEVIVQHKMNKNHLLDDIILQFNAYKALQEMYDDVEGDQFILNVNLDELSASTNGSAANCNDNLNDSGKFDE
ncbi:uncharacterized protein LOC111693411 [Trichogramma pretiosum]|uniref:uncharacterized protein LOC111693411 n=1 Tax=Trichogramma pretiosum TaxID=7493 RepID=UPI000C71B55E|nr:uncharacterized protein LOC111693411 [Trichogramma pretiosum]